MVRCDMTAYGRFWKTHQVATPENGGVSRTQARQALLKQIRKQSTIVAKRLTSKYGR